MKRIIIFSGILVFIILIYMLPNDFSVAEKEDDELVMKLQDYAFENYEIHAASDYNEKDESTLLFDVNSDTVDIDEFYSDISDKLDRYGLADAYTIEIEQTSAEEKRLEVIESNITEMVEDYLNENNLENNVSYAVNIDDNLNIHLNILENSNVDEDELEEIMDDFLNFEIKVE